MKSIIRAIIMSMIAIICISAMTSCQQNDGSISSDAWSNEDFVGFYRITYLESGTEGGYAPDGNYLFIETDLTRDGNPAYDLVAMTISPTKVVATTILYHFSTIKDETWTTYTYTTSPASEARQGQDIAVQFRVFDNGDSTEARFIFPNGNTYYAVFVGDERM